MEKSCGAVVYTATEKGIKYLLVRSKDGNWGFPKGHTELGESELETALREIREETGIEASFLDGFRTEDEYSFTRQGHPRTHKKVVYFLAEYRNQAYTAQEAEIDEIALMDYTHALSALHFDGAKRILTAADDFLREDIKKASRMNPDAL